MTEDNRFGSFGGNPAASTAAGEDLGFFASAPVRPPAEVVAPDQSPVDNRFGGPPAPPAPPPGQFAPPSQFAPPPPGQFAAAAPFGAPVGHPQQSYPPVQQRRGMPAWAIVAICVPAALIVVGILAAIAIPVFLNARNTPVAPESLGGMSATTDPQMTQAVTTVKDQLTRDNTAIKVEAAGYGTMTNGYVLMALGARVDTNREFGDLGATNGTQSFGDVQCAVNATNHVSLCLRTSLRGAVELVSFGGITLPALAQVTNEAWAAQPYGSDCDCAPKPGAPAS
jgi:hypothetical protein